MRRSLLLLVTVAANLYSSQSFSNSGAQAFIEFLETTKKLNLNLDKINKAQSACDVSKAPLQCTTASICSKLDSNGLYVYKNDQGQKQPNPAMVVASYNYSACGSGMKGVLNDDPFIYFEKMIDANEAGGKANLERNQKQFQQAMNRTEKTFEDVKANFLKALDARKNSTNSAQIENLKNRVRSVKFFKYSVNDISSPDIAVDCETPNAFYKSQKNQIIICPQMLNNPDGALFHLIAHEIGHSMDSCNISMNLQDGISYPAGMPAPATSGPLVSKGLSVSENPYQSVYACLSSDQVISLPKMSKDELNNMYSKYLKENPNEAAGMKSEIEWVNSNYERYSGCNWISRGHEQEASADWLGSEAVAEKLKTFQDTNMKKQFAFESTLASGNLCSTMSDNALKTLRTAQGNHPCKNIDDHIKFLENKDEDFSEDHPAPRERVNNIILANPEIQKALNCKGAPQAPYCGKDH